jgi:hypothetical protein
VISLELGYFIAKFYVVAYFLCFLFSYQNKLNNQSNLIITTTALISCVFNQYLRETLGFYMFYLGAAFQVLFSLLISLIIHLYFKIKHEKTTVFVYWIYVLIAMSFMILHRVRVVIYDNDEPILWLINLQSAFTLSLYFLSICLFLLGCNIKWKSQFGRLSSLF